MDMSITGKYRVFEDGVLISEQSNVLTTAGKKELLGVIAGTSARISRLGLGCMDGTVSVDDLTLFMPVYDTPIDFSVPLLGGADSKVVYKARLPEAFSGVIYEIGAYNGPEYNEPLVMSFGDAEGDINNLIGRAGGGTYDVRIGPTSPVIETDETFTVYRECSAGALLPTDEIAIAVKPELVGASTLLVTLTDINGGGAVVSYTLAANSNYQVIKKSISAFDSIDPLFDWNGIASCTVTHSGAANTIILDGLAVLAPLQAGKLLSHAVYTTPIVKRTGVRMDVEYEVGFNLA